MVLKKLSLLNWKNIQELELEFDDKLNCLIGLNGQGKTNILEAIYMLSFTKSAFTVLDSQLITHGEKLAMVQGTYSAECTMHNAQCTMQNAELVVSCGLRAGQKKQFRLGKKDYKRLLDHIGLIPLVMVTPQDGELIEDGSDSRRRFLDSILGQCDKTYLENLLNYNALLKQRNALLKQLADQENPDLSLLEVFELQMAPLAIYIHESRQQFVSEFIPYFQEIYTTISGGTENVSLAYKSQLNDRELAEAYVRTRTRDIILGWTSQGIHKDDLEMQLGDYSLKQVGSQGQQKTYLLAMKLAQALYLGAECTMHNAELQKPILLLDDIFDKLDSERVARIVQLVQSDRFGQTFITDTNRQHLEDTFNPTKNAKIYHIANGQASSQCH